MKAVKAIFGEVLGLFVDDWAFALPALLWVGVFASPARAFLGVWAGPVLFAGLAGLALIFVVRRARR